jgi:hypothetical protein
MRAVVLDHGLANVFKRPDNHGMDLSLSREDQNFTPMSAHHRSLTGREAASAANAGQGSSGYERSARSAKSRRKIAELATQIGSDAPDIAAIGADVDSIRADVRALSVLTRSLLKYSSDTDLFVSN